MLGRLGRVWIDQKKIGETVGAHRLENMAVGIVEDALAADLVRFRPTVRRPDRDVAAQGVTVIVRVAGRPDHHPFLRDPVVQLERCLQLAVYIYSGGFRNFLGCFRVLDDELCRVKWRRQAADRDNGGEKTDPSIRPPFFQRPLPPCRYHGASHQAFHGAVR